MTPEEARNIEVSKRYEDLYNSDVERFVREVYTSDLVVHCMGAASIHGPEKLIHVEKVVLSAAPRRTMRVDHRHASGSVVVVEATLLDPDQGADWTLPFIAALTCRDGKIAVDRSYAEWPRWPGLDLLK